MSRTRLVAWVVLVAFCVAFWVIVARAIAAPDKPPAEPFCDGSSPGYCNPARHPELDPIPPDAPLVVKLRHQLAKERREHAAALAACRAGR